VSTISVTTRPPCDDDDDDDDDDPVGPAAAGGGCAPGPHGPATPHAEVATRATADGDGAAAAGVHDVDPPSSWQSPESPPPQSSATATCPQSYFQ